MKKYPLFKSFLITLSLLLLLLPLKGQVVRDSLKVNKQTIKAPLFIRKSPVRLAKYLTENDSSEAQKALNIYTWITNNIKYDFKKFNRRKKIKSYSVKQTLRKRKGLCYQYSALFDRLCEHAGLTSLAVVGYTRGFGYIEGETFYEVDHSWNAIRLADKWYLTDLTWGTGVLKQKRLRFKKFWYKLIKKPLIYNRYKFAATPDYNYFLKPSGEMLKDHLPADPLWQLVRFPVSVDTFEKLSWHGYEAKIDSVYQQVVNPDVSFEKLNRYSRMSSDQYYDATAYQTYLFNPKNTRMSAVSSYNQGINYLIKKGTVAEIKATNKKAITELKGSVKYAVQHKKTIKNESRNLLKKISYKRKYELFSPALKRKKANQIRLRFYVSLAERWVPKTESGYIPGSRYQDALNKSYYKMGRYRKSRYQKSYVVKRNKKLIVQYQKDTDSLHISIDSLLIQLKRQIPLLKPFASEVHSLDNSIAAMMAMLGKLVVNYMPLSSILKQMEKIDATGHELDSVSSEAKKIYSTFKETFKSIKKSAHEIRSKSRTAQKMIVQNCKLDKTAPCMEEQYDKFTLKIRDSYKRNILAEQLDYSYKEEYKWNIVAIARMEVEQKNRLLENKKLQEAYMELLIARIKNKKYRSLSTITELEKAGKNTMSYLKRKNMTLK